jgi:hypothetical protein
MGDRDNGREGAKGDRDISYSYLAASQRGNDYDEVITRSTLFIFIDELADECKMKRTLPAVGYILEHYLMYFLFRQWLDNRGFGSLIFIKG